ncbi:MAG: helicase C-terminal domain-containing protein [Bacillota bacterium]|jgi:DNA excision repair protein ERCC-2|nr:helicase C-terminal domain-containing protein [Bacillota bacterium]
MQNNSTNNQINISATRLAQLIHRSGGLAMPVYGGIDSLDGIKLHRKFSEYLKDNTENFDYHYSELSLTGLYHLSQLDLIVNGRLDNLSIKNNQLILYEVKSFQGNSQFLPESGDPVHWAQLKIYANLLKDINPDYYPKLIKNNKSELINAIEKSLQADSITLKLIYIAVDHQEVVEKVKHLTWSELSTFMESTCREFISRMRNIFLWQDLRNSSIQNSAFPFVELRAGQAEMIRQTLATIRDNSTILIQAPTGIGKTMGTLYPALKALSVQYVNRVFYATAMISTRDVALQSLDILRNCGCMIRSILLKAKERICVQPDLFCDQTICPYAVDYYYRLPDAINDLLSLHDIRPKQITEFALKHQVCPHELSLDFSEYCDVIIGDYNHIFDPQAKLIRYFDNANQNDKTAILVDEAHNLPARARTMYSAALCAMDFIKIRNLLRQPNLNFASQYGTLIDLFEVMINEFDSFSRIFKAGKKPAQNSFFVEKLNSKWLIDHDFIGVKQLPDLLVTKIGRMIYQLREFLDQQRMFESRQQVLDFWFDLLYFTKVADFYFNDAYITAFRPNREGYLNCYLLALDTAKHITNCYSNKHPTIFFSATLSPINYYHSLLNNKINDQPAETMSLASPFPTENRMIGALTEYSVRYKDREQTMPQITEFILQACLIHKGNYLIFVPSYQYLFTIQNLLKKISIPEQVELLFQSRNMTELQKKSFLKKFDTFGDNSLIAFAVLGSHFNEGIDLQGEKLSGVIVIGTGIPQISPEREIMTQYYAEKYEGGRAYGYQYPGFNRVQQAVGRLIRSKNDIGFAVLIDDRYTNPEWQSIFPVDWRVNSFDNYRDLLSEIKVFWQDHDLSSLPLD